MAEETKVEDAETTDVQAQGQFVGGEVVIKADAKTGSISVSGPRNVLITLGILEGARAVLFMQMQTAMASAGAHRQPTIVKAGEDALKNLSKIMRPS